MSTRSERRVRIEEPRAPAAASRYRSPGIAGFFTLIYVNLWILEGALRKWIPGLDQPFYVARDVILLGGLVLVMALGGKPRPWFGNALLATSLFAAWLLISSFANQVNLTVSLAGARSYLAPLVFLLLAAGYGDAKLGIRIARTIVAWSFVEAGLVVLQSSSPGDARINQLLNDSANDFIDYGVVRGTGTFTSPSGLTAFAALSLACALALAFGGHVRKDRLVGIAGVIASLLIIALGGSRGAVLAGAVVLGIFFVVSIARAGSRAFRAVSIAAALALAVGVLVITVFPDRLEAFRQRFDNAAQSEDSAARLIGQLTRYPAYFSSLLGDGPGSHAQVGIAGGSGASWIEDDSSKWVAELGIVGLVLATARIAFVVWALALPILRARSISVDSAMFLAAAGGSQLVGQVTQTPTSQAAFGIGVALIYLAFVRQREQLLDTEPRSETDLYPPRTMTHQTSSLRRR